MIFLLCTLTLLSLAALGTSALTFLMVRRTLQELIEARFDAVDFHNQNIWQHRVDRSAMTTLAQRMSCYRPEPLTQLEVMMHQVECGQEPKLDWEKLRTEQ